MSNTKMMLHAGADLVEREELSAVHTPQATPSWVPIPHAQFLEQVEGALTNANIKIKSSEYALAKEGNRFFGLLSVENGKKTDTDYGFCVGVRNSHDKTFPAGILVGSSVFVCDNLAFHAEISVFRKHTTNILRDLPTLTTRAVGLLSEKWVSMTERINLYKTTEISDKDAHDFMVRAYEGGVMPNRQLDTIIKEWRAPRHPEFAQSKNVWRLYNSFTEAAKEGSFEALPRRTIALHGLLDQQVGFKGAIAGLDVQDAEIVVQA